MKSAKPQSPKPTEIRALREETGLTQTEAAAMLYKGRLAWGRWEDGSRKMDPALWELFRMKVADDYDAEQA